MKKIVAPTDFSPVSLNAVDYAADMAAAIGASLLLINVCPLPIGLNEGPYPANQIDRFITEAEEKMQETKDNLIKRLAGKINIYSEVRTGTIITEILAFCQTVNPYVVVMGTRGSNAVERVLFGNITVWATRHLSWPLIIIPPEAKFKDIKKAGLACDLESVETSPLNEIKTLVKEFSAKLSVIHVNTDGRDVYRPEIIAQSGILQEMLEDVHPSYHFLNDIEIEEGLSKFAEDHKLDLLIVVPKKHNIIDQLFHKSHTKKLTLHTNIPLMALHE